MNEISESVCKVCAGKGQKPCTACGGTGTERHDLCKGSGTHPLDPGDCSGCAGTGLVRCSTCEGCSIMLCECVKPTESRPSRAYRCSNCGSEMKCSGTNTGDSYQITDKFVAWCEKCGRVETTRMGGGSAAGTAWFNECPYCGVKDASHGSVIPLEVVHLVYPAVLAGSRTSSSPTGVLAPGNPVIPS